MSVTQNCRTDPPCSLCCKTFRIEELDKPRMTWCAMCKPAKGGCTVYAQRPPSCQEFECVWLMSQDDPDQTPMPTELKPSACNAVMHITKDGKKLVIDMNDGGDWRAGALGTFIARASHDIPVFVRIRDRLIYISKNVILSDHKDPRLMTAPKVDITLPDAPHYLQP